MKKLKLDEIAEVVNKIQLEKPVKQKGFIMMPTDDGIDFYEIDKDRLQAYLQQEQYFSVTGNSSNEESDGQ